MYLFCGRQAFPASISICNLICMDRIVLHIDMDAFFAAVEERDKPRLKGQPIVVGADPKGGQGRGVVSTANYKAREYGIHSAQPISIAWRLSEEAARKGKPRAVFLEPDFRNYSETSKAIMDYLRTKGETLEQASIDEAYLEIKTDNLSSEGGSSYGGQLTTDNKENFWKRIEEKAKEIKREILKNQKLTCSVGIGPNKLIAKIAAGRHKPDGLTIVKPDEIQKFLDPLPVREIPGIGPKSQEILLRQGVRTIEDLRKLSEEKLKNLFGKWGLDMYKKAQGIDESLVTAEYETKSIGEQETYDTDTLDSNFLVGRIKALAQSVFKTVQREGFLFKTVSITVRFEDFETKTRAHTFSEPVADIKALEHQALQLFLPFLDQRENPRKKLIRLLGVRVEKLSLSVKKHTVNKKLLA